ncbi:MAG: glycosyltransferase family 4 protein, partial [candidate division KSB1 bacterium]|nr:glycosyltransferase family 4 protein [candidate division KSB1 bacterium]
MKIVYFNYLYDLWGASIGSTIKGIKLMEAIENCGHEVKIYWRKDDPNARPGVNGRLTAREILKKYLAKYLHEPNQILYNWKFIREERAILERERPDVLITRLDAYVFSSMWLAKRMGIPVVLEADSPVSYELRTFHREYWTLPGVLDSIEKYNLRRADAAVVVSNVLADYFMQRQPRDDGYVVITNGADIERFHPQISGDDVRTKFSLNNDIVIGFIGSFHRWHGVENLIALLKPVLERNANVKFLLVGEGGPLKPTLEGYIRKHTLQHRVILTGHVPHEKVPGHIAAMDIVLAPYPKLPFFYYSPVKVYEYMACGKCVVASRLGQIAEAIEDGRSGFLVEPGKIEDYLAALQKLI